MVDTSEEARLALLERLELLDSAPEQEFDAVVQLAQQLTGCKIALVSLVDAHRQWFKAKAGLDVNETPRDIAFCAHAVAADDVLVVPDARQDDRFADNPLVTGAPDIRFYAGVPIHAAEDASDDTSPRLPLGTLCVIDDQPRTIDPAGLKMLGHLATLVETLISARRTAALAVQMAEERGHNLRDLSRKHRQLRQAERIANIGSWRLTLGDNQLEWSDQTYAIHELECGAEISLKAALDFYAEKSREILVSTIEQTLVTGEPFDVEADFTTARGNYRRVRSMGELELENGKPVALIGVFQDITERHKMEEALRHAAHTDDLTRIASRGRCNQVIDDSIKTTAAAGQRCALLLIDLDHFKAVNDRLGHQAGDDVLRVIASRLQAPYLAGSFAARLGGDEFVLLITDQALLRDLRGLLRRLLLDLRYSIRADKQTFRVSATIGAAWLDAQTASRSDLLRNADAALYAAKRRERGTAVIAGQAVPIAPGQSDVAPVAIARQG
ncbi:diguanylate cyclase (GGDEF)-like protein/PAS domain S-box-containing protein [Novosphingobium capsulatum]|uniref:Diguanylate cyclase (GGDEF)-like protein/PAS domain S-box-containing protein n=1 Tax=Novosphingobium capsulatum TaxID=13688 RepID=A0ABU1MPD9_9SPHN|nr:diguanylate cyclase [Novosphingobium capsulatum]MDR6512221.1 diguanylate cyclase (GGDEF)-like protein/PAS domain S-box-containing protein [Novosphingobium capsulatum]